MTHTPWTVIWIGAVDEEQAAELQRWAPFIAEAQAAAESIPTARDPWSYAR